MADLQGSRLIDDLCRVGLLKPGEFHWSEAHVTLDMVALVRAEIERRGLVPEFMEELTDTVGPERWRILNATPEQQSRAALAAVEGANA